MGHPAYDAQMASLNREVVLKEKPVQSEGGFIPLGALANSGIKPVAPSAPVKTEVEETVSGD